MDTCKNNSLHLSIYLSVCLSACLPVCLSVSLSPPPPLLGRHQRKHYLQLNSKFQNKSSTRTHNSDGNSSYSVQSNFLASHDKGVDILHRLQQGELKKYTSIRRNSNNIQVRNGSFKKLHTRSISTIHFTKMGNEIRGCTANLKHHPSAIHTFA